MSEAPPFTKHLRGFVWLSWRWAVWTHIGVLGVGLALSVYFHSMLGATATLWAFALLPSPRNYRD